MTAIIHHVTLGTLEENMRIVRYELKDGRTKPKYGWLLGDKVGEISGNVFGRYRRKEAETPPASDSAAPSESPAPAAAADASTLSPARRA